MNRLVLRLTMVMIAIAAAVPAQRSVPDEPRLVGADAVRQAVAATKIPLSAAIDRALAKVPGSALRAGLEPRWSDGKLVLRYEIEVFKDDSFHTVVVDPASGDILGVETHASSRPARLGEMVFDFESGEMPAWFDAGEIAGAGTPAAWRVERTPDGRRVLAVESANRKMTFNHLIRRGKVGPDVSLSVRIQAGSGDEDQGGGLVWRARDAENYYVARWNPLEKNLRAYSVTAGKRSTPFKSVAIEADPAAWHEIAVTAIGPRMSLRFDGRQVMDFEDATFADAGAIGVWTKADASSRFDDLRVLSLPR